MQKATDKVFLLLQGPPSGFSRHLAQELESRGARCFRINLCLGDWFYWPKGATNYRGTLNDWADYLTSFIKQHQITDILYYADRLPYHRVAIDVARQQDINAITYENGYLRPHWITVEHGGMSRQSHFPIDPDYIRQEGVKHPQPKAIQGLGHPFWQEAFHEVFFHMANYLDLLAFRKYHSDKVYNPLKEYLHYIPRLLKERSNLKRAQEIIEQLIQNKDHFYLYPLQMNNDYQLRENSPFSHQKEAIELAIKAFAKHAPSHSKLLFKIHPLDNGIEPWEEIIHHLTQQHNVRDRVLYIDGGNLQKLIGYCKGIITTNSTVGVHGFQQLAPVKCLGYAMYDIPGLTSQQNLNNFFAEPEAPDSELVDRFVRLVAATIQIQGSFYSPKGRKLAIQNLAEKLIANSVNEPGVYIHNPPRLKLCD